MRIIKRYANRKLYDTQDRRYVTLVQVAERLRSGEEVQIVDNRSAEDITSITLSQILTDAERRKTGLLPKTFLADLVRRGGDTLAGIMKGPSRALGQAKTIAALVEDEVEKRIKSLLHAGEISQKQAQRIVEAARQSTAEQRRLVESRVEEALRSALTRLDVPTKKELDQLNARLDQLQSSLDKARGKRPRVTPAKSPRVRVRRPHAGA